MISAPIKYRKLKSYKYQTLEDALFYSNIYPPHDVSNGYITLKKDGRLIIAKFYCWDGTSGPTVDGPTNMSASLAHDALYQLIRENFLSFHYKSACDYFFIEICNEKGMCEVRQWVDLRGLQMFGRNSCEPRVGVELQDQVFTAP